MTNVLVTRSMHDLATTYLASYGALLVNQARQWGHSVTDLYADAATNENFGREIEVNDLFIGFGHGRSDLFTGQELEVLLKDTVNADVMSDKDCYLASCQTGIKLGPAMVEKTCPRFFGYQGDWVFVYHPDYYAEGRILEDPYAKSFFDSVLTTGYAILLGKSFEEVYNETVDRYKYWWDWWLKQNDPMTDSILTWLNWNRQNFIAINAEPPETRVIGTPKLTIGAVALPLGAAALLLLLSRLEKKAKPI